MTCNFCGGVAHPATGHAYGPRTIACRACTLDFWRWVERHTNGKGSRRARRVPVAETFYEHAARSTPRR